MGNLRAHSPENTPYRDIKRKLATAPDLFLVAWEQKKLAGTIMGGYEGHRGWINYLAVHPQFRGGKTGTTLVETLEEKLRRLGCPKINLQVRTTNSDVISFYKALGYREDHVISLGKRLINDQ